ncbi:MAG: pyridoxal phosphate-dependent aminotransferase [Leptonema sp. (in: bacteria)]
MDIDLSNILSKRMDSIDTSQIRKMFDLAQKLKNPINLSIGQPHFPTPKPILEAMNKALYENKTSYTMTQGILELREKLVEKFYKKNKIQTSPDSILISSGVSSLLLLLFMAIVEPEDEVLLIEPTFLIYRGLVSFFQGKEILISQHFTKEDLEKLKFQKLKMILFSTPSNPTGYILKKEQILELAELAEKTKAVLVSDEIYELYDYDNLFISPGSLYPKTLTLMGFSKSYSMTGLRLSAATGPKNLIQALTKLQQYTIVCAPTPVQYAGITALDVDVSSHIEYYKKNRDRLKEELKKFTELYEPEGAFYIFTKIPSNWNDLEFCEYCIQNYELLVVPGRIFSNQNQWIRISYAVDQETLERGIEALKNAYNHHKFLS